MTATTATLHITEMFDSIQGEGILCGRPSTFIRLAHCNLSCEWCDAAYTWKGTVAYDELDLDAVVARATLPSVVVTGGEPTIADAFPRLVTALAAAGKHVTVETNGTTWREPDAPGAVRLWSVSPKLGSSGQVSHLNPDILRQYIELAAATSAGLPHARVQLKFVIDDIRDLHEVAGLVRGLDIPHTLPLLLQPNGLVHNVELRNTATNHMDLNDGSPEPRIATGVHELRTPYADRLRWLYEHVTAAVAAGDLPPNARAVPQLHKLAWGNRRGF
jgi:organic radical activating enzyme